MVRNPVNGAPVLAATLWAGLVVLANTVVVLLCRRFKLTNHDKFNAAQWTTRFVIAETAYGVAWSLLSLFTLTSSAPNLSVAMFAMVLVGIAANSVSTRTLPGATLVSTLPATLTVSINLVISGGTLNYALAAVTVGGEIFFVYLAKQLHRSELDSMVTAVGGGRRAPLSLDRYFARLDPPHGRRIALVTAVGTIAEGRSRNSANEGQILGAETLIKALRDVRNRESIEAIVLRVDSPGGSAQASDEIWQEVRRCADRKPVIASFSDLAASGGYYIAAPADSIVADAGTLTGSIGAFGGKLNLLGLYRKLGLNVETVSRGRHAGMFSAFRDFTPEEAERFQGQMDEVYRVFLDRVSEGRGRPASEIDSVGQGRVWSGLAAYERGLVDALGGVTRALAMARAAAGIDEDEALAVDVYPRVERTFFQRLFAEMLADEEALESVTLPPVIRSWLAAASFPSGAALALMPWSIEVR